MIYVFNVRLMQRNMNATMAFIFFWMLEQI